MNHCRDCRWWLKTHVQLRHLPDDRAHRAESALTHGAATEALAILREMPRVDEFCRCLRSGSDGLVYGHLDTKADFGCVLWEAK